MGNADKHNKEYHLNQILLLGQKGSGKTKFLYENLLQGKWSGTTEPSLGYNFEVIKYNQYQFGVWDLAGMKQFQALWKVFYKFVPFKATILMIKYDDEVEQKKEKYLAKARKLLHFISNNPNFKNKLLCVINNTKKKNQSPKNLEDLQEILFWDEVDVEHKVIIQFDVFGTQDEYDEFWQFFEEHYRKVYPQEIK